MTARLRKSGKAAWGNGLRGVGHGLEPNCCRICRRMTGLSNHVYPLGLDERNESFLVETWQERSASDRRNTRTAPLNRIDLCRVCSYNQYTEYGDRVEG